MKNIIATALVAIAATAGAASAMSPSPSTVDLHQIQNYAPQADLSGLSATDVNVLISVIQSGDSEGEKAASVRALLR